MEIRKGAGERWPNETKMEGRKRVLERMTKYNRKNKNDQISSWKRLKIAWEKKEKGQEKSESKETENKKGHWRQ